MDDVTLHGKVTAQICDQCTTKVLIRVITWQENQRIRCDSGGRGHSEAMFAGF